jgi:hypothetical protein
MGKVILVLFSIVFGCFEVRNHNVLMGSLLNDREKLLENIALTFNCVAETVEQR